MPKKKFYLVLVLFLIANCKILCYKRKFYNIFFESNFPADLCIYGFLF